MCYGHAGLVVISLHYMHPHHVRVTLCCRENSNRCFCPILHMYWHRFAIHLSVYYYCLCRHVIIPYGAETVKTLTCNVISSGHILFRPCALLVAEDDYTNCLYTQTVIPRNRLYSSSTWIYIYGMLVPPRGGGTCTVQYFSGWSTISCNVVH